MSIFNELLPKVNEIETNSTKNINDELQAIFKCIDKLAEDCEKGRGGARDRTLKDKTRMTALQSINEDDGESPKTANKDLDSALEISTEKQKRVSKKRSKDEVDGGSSPEKNDKRQKRNASVKATTNISKQGKEVLKELSENEVEIISSNVVNVNLVQKLRREDTLEKSRSRRRKDDDKENDPMPAIQIKQEKISLLPEPMDTASLPVEVAVNVKKEPEVMPPPVAPVPKPRKAVQKERSEESSEEENGSSRRRNTRTRKQTDADAMPPPPVPSARSTRASSRASSRKQTDTSDETLPPPPIPDARPKRTRGRKKVSEATSTESEKEASVLPNDLHTASPTEKRPKRTKRGQKAAEKEKPQEPEPKPAETISPKEERISQPEPTSPLLLPKSKPRLGKTDEIPKKSDSKTKNDDKKTKSKKDVEKTDSIENETVKSKKDGNKKDLTENETAKSKKDTNKRDSTDNVANIALDETRVIVSKMNTTVTLSSKMDETVVLPNGVYNHAPVTPKNIYNNETMVLHAGRATMVLEKHTHVNDATVIIDKEPAHNITDDNSSLMTEDNSTSEEKIHTPPKGVPNAQPTSAVKEKVQQFEEMASRTTRTKTRAMAKMEEPDNNTPPDKVSKPILSVEILNKMNNMIFNGKTQQMSSSAIKPKAILPPMVHKSHSASTSKLTSLARHREAADECLKEDARKKKADECLREDARKKKEAMLEAKREQQKKKREEKMANAAAAREAAERERRLREEAAARERQEKQAQQNQGRLEKLKEVERKKLEQARKIAETEERRRAEEVARQQRLAEDQKRAEAAKRKQEENEAMKKEAAIMAKEIEKRQREYMEKQKLKQKLESEKMTPGTPIIRLEPVYMDDGFEFLNSDEDEEPAPRPTPAWSTFRARKEALTHQSSLPTSLIDALFSVRVHSPDLREIFPAIERARLKRTSSAVWRTPPNIRLHNIKE